MENPNNDSSSSSLGESGERKLKLEFKLLRIQYILAVIALVHVIAFVLGAFLGFWYLVRHQFNPGGVTASDTLAMVLWSLGFTVVLGFGLAFATISGFPAARALHLVLHVFANILSRFKPWNSFPLSGFWWAVHYGSPNKFKWRRGEWLLLLVGSSGLLLFVWLIVRLPLEQGSFFFVVLLIGVFLSHLAFGKVDESYEPLCRRNAQSSVDVTMRRLSPRKRNIIVASVVVATMIVPNFGTWLDISAILIGFREQNVSVRVSKEDFDEVIRRSSYVGIVINPCENIIEDSSVLRHADILWQSLGTQSLLRFPSQPIGISPKDSDTIRLKASNASLGSVVSGGNVVRCREFLADMLFHPGTAELHASGSNRLLQQLHWLRDSPAGSKIKVIVHSASGASAAEDARTLRQALNVKAALSTAFNFAAGDIEAVGAGQSAGKIDCVTRVTVQRALCDKVNRRVEVSLFLPM